MRKFFISCFCYIIAIIVAIAMVGIVVWFCNFAFGQPFAAVSYRLFWLFTSGWILYDNKRLRAWRYHAGLPEAPVVWLFFFILIGWPIVLPYYLGLRFRITMGTARLREEFKPLDMDDETIGPNGLIQPWRGKRI